MVGANRKSKIQVILSKGIKGDIGENNQYQLIDTLDFPFSNVIIISATLLVTKHVTKSRLKGKKVAKICRDGRIRTCDLLLPKQAR